MESAAVLEFTLVMTLVAIVVRTEITLHRIREDCLLRPVALRRRDIARTRNLLLKSHELSAIPVLQSMMLLTGYLKISCVKRMSA